MRRLHSANLAPGAPWKGRAAVMRSFQQTPSSKARWFAVHCDKDSPGWVHENFVKAM